MNLHQVKNLLDIDKIVEKALSIALGFSMLLFVSFIAAMSVVLNAQAESGNAQSGNEQAQTCGGTDLVAKMQRQEPGKFASLQKAASRTQNGNGLLWKVEKSGQASSYLFGTMHQADPRIARLKGEVSAAFDGAKTIIVESTEALDPQKAAAAMAENINQMIFADGTTLDQLLEAEVLRQLKKELALRGMPYEAVKSMRPWMVASMVSLPVCEFKLKHSGEPFLDKLIAEKAVQTGKKLDGLESVNEQIKALVSLQQEFHIDSLAETVKLGSVMADLNETMKQLYLKGNIAMILPFFEMMAPAQSDAQKKSYAHFQEVLIESRNARMAERAKPHLETGGAFIAVGALHLPGKTGLVEAFRQMGYKVNRAD